MWEKAATCPKTSSRRAVSSARRRYQWQRTNFWRSEWAFASETGRLLVSFDPDFSLLKHAATVKVRSILLDETFGFDADTGLAPTNTFHVGIWFDDPADAAPCGFTGAPTPFNGSHDAGPVAFISRPDATSGLGPLCTKPDTTTNPPSCQA